MIDCDKNVQTEFTQSSSDGRIDRNVIDLFHHLIGKIDDLTTMMDVMRKQNARFEAKLLHCERMNIHGVNAGVCNDGSMSVDHFINLESSLAAEGLPVRSCSEVVHLETKLKESSDYSKGLVKYMIALSLTKLSFSVKWSFHLISLFSKVKLLSIINGDEGTRKGGDTIMSVIDAIIDPRTLAEYSWSGKSGQKGVVQKRFDDYTQIINLIYTVCRIADQKYAYKDCRSDLVYKVFKYAKSRLSKKQLYGTVSVESDYTNDNEYHDVNRPAEEFKDGTVSNRPAISEERSNDSRSWSKTRGTFTAHMHGNNNINDSAAFSGNTAARDRRIHDVRHLNFPEKMFNPNRII